MLTRAFVFLACIVLGSGIGYLLGKREVPTNDFVVVSRSLNDTQDISDEPLSLREAVSLEKPFERTQAIYAIASNVDNENFDAYLAALRDFPREGDRMIALEAVFISLGSNDPEAAFEQSMKLTIAEGNTAFPALFRAWPANRLDQLVHLIAGISDTNFRQRLADQLVLTQPEGDALVILLDDAIGNGFDNSTYLLKKIKKAAYLDPKATFQGLSMGENFTSITTMVEIAKIWVDQDASGVLEYVTQHSSQFSVEAQLLTQTVLHELALADPYYALEAAQKLKQGSLFNDSPGVVIGKVAESDIMLAQELANSLKGQTRQIAWSSLAHTWAQQDYLAAYEWFENLDEEDPDELALKSISSSAIIGAVLKNDPSLASVLLDESEGPLSSEMVQNIALSAYQQSPDTLKQIINSTENRSLVNKLMSTLTSMDPEFVASVAAEDNDINVDISNLAMNWSFRDKDASLAWALNLEPSKDKTQAISHIANAWAAGAPDEAEALLPSLPKDAQAQWLGALADSKAVANWEDAAQWILGYETSPGFEEQAKRIAIKGLKKDAEAALAFAETYLNERDLDAVSYRAIRNWAATDPEAAQDYVLNLTDESRKQKAVVRLVGAELKENRDNPNVDWIDQLAPGKTQDLALLRLATSSKTSARLPSYLNRISSDAARLGAWSTVIHRESIRNPRSARRLIAEARLADDEKALLQRIISD